jgi:pimeloyl-ACP methyl ester carboxylesterase
MRLSTIGARSHERKSDMVRSRTRQWATRVGRRARRARSAVEATIRQLGHSLWQRAPVQLRLPGTPRVGSTRFARNGPVTLAYDLRGRGSPLVLIQGVGVGRWGWEPVAARLARRFQVVSIDNRGIGASDTAPGHYSIRVMADDVLAVLDHAGVRQASLVGTSLGGMIAQELALAHPKRVDKLVLVATIPGGPRSRPMPLPTTYLFAWAPFMTSRAKLQQFVHATLGPETLRRRPKVARRLAARKLAHPQSESAWRAQTEAGMLFNPLGRQRRITQPTWSCRAPPTRSSTPATPRSWPACSPTPGCNGSTGRVTCSTGSSPSGSCVSCRLPHRSWLSSARASHSRPPGQLERVNGSGR